MLSYLDVGTQATLRAEVESLQLSLSTIDPSNIGRSRRSMSLRLLRLMDLRAVSRQRAGLPI
jgi:hypothetical protein